MTSNWIGECWCRHQPNESKTSILMSNYKCKLCPNQTYSFFGFGFWTHTHIPLCVHFFAHMTYSLRMFVIFVVLYDADMTCLMWCKFFRTVTGTHPQSPQTLHLSFTWFHDLPTPNFSSRRPAAGGKGGSGKSDGKGGKGPQKPTDDPDFVRWSKQMRLEGSNTGRVSFERIRCVCFLVFCWWCAMLCNGEGEFHCFQQFWVFVLFISCWKVLMLFILVDHGPLCLPTSLMFVFCHKGVPFRHFGKVLGRSMPFKKGIAGSRVLPFPGVGVDFSL